jgi:hypothetical protein
VLVTPAGSALWALRAQDITVNKISDVKIFFMIETIIM